MWPSNGWSAPSKSSSSSEPPGELRAGAWKPSFKRAWCRRWRVAANCPSRPGRMGAPVWVTDLALAPPSPRVAAALDAGDGFRLGGACARRQQAAGGARVLLPFPAARRSRGDGRGGDGGCLAGSAPGAEPGTRASRRFEPPAGSSSRFGGRRHLRARQPGKGDLCQRGGHAAAGHAGRCSDRQAGARDFALLGSGRPQLRGGLPATAQHGHALRQVRGRHYLSR